MSEKAMQDGEYGIKETLEGLDFIIPFANVLDSTTQDGFKWTEVIEFVPALTKLPTAIAGGKDIPKELADLSDMERQQLIDKVRDLDFDDDHAEVIGEKALAALVALGELIVVMRSAKK